jgi:hypothetical protein
VLRDAWRGLLLLAVIHAGFFWKITLSSQFSFLIHWDNANQVFPWTQFVVRSLANGELPLWDPHAFAGRPFVGEMQTALFNLLSFPLYAAGWLAGGTIQPRWMDLFVVGCHLAACWFLYLLALRLRLSRSAAIVAACVFGLGGFVGNLPWPGMLSSSVWLPLMVWAAIESLESRSLRLGLLPASVAGLGFGLVALAGGMQILFADGLLIAGLCLYWPLRHRGTSEPWRKPLLRGAACAVVIGVAGLLAGAAQLLPSIEYARHSLRWVGGPEPLPALEQVPYHLLSTEAALPPRALLNFLFGRAPIGTSEIAPYFGILPLLLAAAAVWRRWDDAFVRFLAAAAGVALFCALGGESLLHGLLYAVLPMADKAREAGRFLYLTHFCAALLCGYGFEAAFRRTGKTDGWEKAVRYLNIGLFVLLLALASAFILRIEIADSTYLSLLLAAGSIAVLNGRHHLERIGAAAALVTALIFCDLYAFYRPIRNHAEETAAGNNLLQRVLDAKALAEYFRAQPGNFRISIEDPLIRGIGDLYGLDTVNAGAVTVDESFSELVTKVPRRLDLLNVGFSITTQERSGRPAVFASGPWFVYDQPSSCPRAWIAAAVTNVASVNEAWEVMRADAFEPCVEAIVISGDDARTYETSGGSVKVEARGPGYYELKSESAAAGLLVLSESFAPGWRVEVDGVLKDLVRVDGALQGVWLDAGEHHVTFEYRPVVLYVGLGVTAATFVLVGVGLVWVEVRRRMQAAVPAGPTLR